MAKSRSESAKEDSIVKKGILYIKPTRSSDNYLNESAFDIVQELLGAGFESVTLKPVKKLSERAIKKYGNVKSISINGHSEFMGVKRVPASSLIVIEYLDFKSGVCRTVYDNVIPLKAGKIRSVEDLEMQSPQNKSPKCISKAFCAYCGEKILDPNARYCFSCGKEI